MKIEGGLLLFETPCSKPFSHMFSKDCKISIPEKVPIIWDFKPWNPENVIGTAEVIRDEEGLYMKGELTKDIPEEVNGLGGFYSRIEFNPHIDSVHIVKKADLYYVSITPTPILKDYKFKYVKSKNERVTELYNKYIKTKEN